MKKTITIFTFIFTAAFLSAQGSAPYVAPAPKTAAAPKTSAAPRVKRTPASQSAPRLSNAPSLGSAPYVSTQPSVQNAPSVSAAPQVSSNKVTAPQVSGQKSYRQAALKGEPLPTMTVEEDYVFISYNEEDGTAAQGTLTVKEDAAGKTAKSASLKQDPAVLKLKEWDKKLKTLKTDFEQKTAFEGILMSASAGRLYYEQPSLLRLEQFDAQGETSQIALTNKKDIKIYDAAMSPITNLKWSDWQKGQTNSALFDFGNYTKIIETHFVSAVVKKEGQTEIYLTPEVKDGLAGYVLIIKVSNTDYFPLAIELQVDGMSTIAMLKSTQKNIPLEKGIFGSFKK